MILDKLSTDYSQEFLKSNDLFVASHDDDLDLALHDHPPEVVDRVGQRPLAGDVRIAAAGSLQFKTTINFICLDGPNTV